MTGIKNIFVGTALVIGGVALALQLNATRQLRTELAAVRQHLNSIAPKMAGDSGTENDPAAPRRVVVRTDSNSSERLAQLEAAIAELKRESQYLKSRGELPLGANDIAQARSRFADATLSDRDRLRALQQLRRNDALTDDLAWNALAWAQTATNAATRRELLQQLDGIENPTFVAPLLEFARSDGDANVREEAVENLRGFMGDAQVETALWDILRNDPDGDVRREAERALSRGPFSETRIAALHERALDSQLSLDERLIALRALDRAGVKSTPVTATLADLAQSTTDPNEKLRLFRAFDGLNDPVVKLPLVYGLQDSNPLVREEAVDALSDFRDDPAVLQWLQYVSQNDADPQVRREAFQALADD